MELWQVGSFDAGYGSSIMSRLVSFKALWLLAIFWLLKLNLCNIIPLSNVCNIHHMGLVKQIGPKKAREMWYLTRFYTANEAERMGLVNTVVPVSYSLALLSEINMQRKGVWGFELFEYWRRYISNIAVVLRYHLLCSWRIWSKRQ